MDWCPFKGKAIIYAIYRISLPKSRPNSKYKFVNPYQYLYIGCCNIPLQVFSSINRRGQLIGRESSFLKEGKTLSAEKQKTNWERNPWIPLHNGSPAPQCASTNLLPISRQKVRGDGAVCIWLQWWRPGNNLIDDTYKFPT